jgi:hypothetical protein
MRNVPRVILINYFFKCCGQSATNFRIFRALDLELGHVFHRTPAHPPDCRKTGNQSILPASKNSPIDPHIWRTSAQFSAQAQVLIRQIKNPGCFLPSAPCRIASIPNYGTFPVVPLSNWEMWRSKSSKVISKRSCRSRADR